MGFCWWLAFDYHCQFGQIRGLEMAKPKPSNLGSGMAAAAAKKLKNRKRKIDEAVNKATKKK